MVRAGPSLHYHVVASLSDGKCLSYKEHDQIGPDGILWARTDYNGQITWIQKNYVDIEPCNTDKLKKRAEQCACISTDSVHVRAGASLHAQTLATLQAHQCLTYKNNKHVADGYTWVNVDYHGQDAWIAENYVHIGACTSGTHPSSPGGQSNVNLSGCPHIVTRSEWGARAPTHPLIHLPATPKYFFIHHGASPPCHTKEDCIAKVRSTQAYHMDGRQYSDVGYSFLVGEDGNIYEGRGWDYIGGHTLHYNSVGLAVCFLGNFMDHVPNDAALNAVKQLIACGVANHKISNSYILHGHRDVGQTACPGTKLYDLIQSWPHYSKHQA
ncbi:hypothetical protein CHS0354_020383 [Potamilus streckersoni]|uniref:Peptidoglycan recognition protein n=1 Tax=Potamilus streckersoni TaxID=2493646 RepID=A0AAE0TFK8_9BIVA|nr:hypothetical protein CHS0354_020383 [Potamilus streckersoni]